MKTNLLILLILCGCLSANGQVYVMDWSSAFTTAWTEGAVTRTANNVQGSQCNVSVSVSRTGGIFARPYGGSGPQTPTVGTSTITVGSSTANLQVAVDFTARNQRAEILITFSQPVWNLRFQVADIDRLTNTSISYFDRLTVEGFMTGVTYNPSITKADNTDPNWLMVSSPLVRVNTANGTAGNAASESGDSRGTANIAFMGQYLTSVRIRYDNDNLVQADPGVQFIGVGNLTFQNGIILPVKLTSFNGTAQGKNALLNWDVAEESGLKEYVIERSNDGAHNFTEVGTLGQKDDVDGASSYNYTDYNVPIATAYYRLKIIEHDGSIQYSRIVKLQFAGGVELQAFPTMFTNGVNLSVSSTSVSEQEFLLINSMGQVVHRQSRPVNKGRSNFWFALPASLPSGMYYLRNGTSVVRLLKQ